MPPTPPSTGCAARGAAAASSARWWPTCTCCLLVTWRSLLPGLRRGLLEILALRRGRSTRCTSLARRAQATGIDGRALTTGGHRRAVPARSLPGANRRRSTRRACWRAVARLARPSYGRLALTTRSTANGPLYGGVERCGAACRWDPCARDARRACSMAQHAPREEEDASWVPCGYVYGSYRHFATR